MGNRGIAYMLQGVVNKAQTKWTTMNIVDVQDIKISNHIKDFWI